MLPFIRHERLPFLHHAYFCGDVDRAARQVLVDVGWGEYFIHRTGHGLGLDVHKEPGIVEGNDMPLERRVASPFA